MASNPYVNKVVYGNTTIIDLSVDTVNSSDDIASGKIAHLSTGEQVVGTGGTTPKGTIITTAPSGSVVTLTKESTVYTPSEVRRVNPKWRNLPSGYTQVEYIESSGSQCIDLPVQYSSITKIKTEVQSPNAGYIVGGQSTIPRYMHNTVYRAFTENLEFIFTAYGNDVHTIECTNTLLILDGTAISGSANTESSANVNIRLFANGTSKATDLKMYAMEITASTNYDLVPCKRDSDSVVSFYDMTSNSFITPSGTFTAGAEVSQYLDTSLYTQLVDYGTWTVQGTLSGKSASATVVVDATQEYEVELAYELYLYNAGDECTSITGGWDVSNSVVFQGWSSFSRTDATKGTDSINASLATNKTTSYGINNTVNVSAYSKIKFEINVSTYSSTTHMARLSLTSAKSFSATEEYAFVEYSGMNTGSYVWELDISDVANAGYVCISEFSITTQLSAVWLE